MDCDLTNHISKIPLYPYRPEKAETINPEMILKWQSMNLSSSADQEIYKQSPVQS